MAESFYERKRRELGLSSPSAVQVTHPAAASTTPTKPSFYQAKRVQMGLEKPDANYTAYQQMQARNVLSTVKSAADFVKGVAGKIKDNFVQEITHPNTVTATREAEKPDLNHDGQWDTFELPAWAKAPGDAIDKWLHSNPVGRGIDRFSQAADSVFGVTPESVGETWTSTGNKTVDKGLDIAGGLAGYTTNPSQIEQSLITGSYGAARSALNTGLGQRAERGLQNALTRANNALWAGLSTRATDRIATGLIEGGVANALQNVAVGAMSGQTSVKEIAENAAVGGVLGGAGDSLVGAVGPVIERAFSRFIRRSKGVSPELEQATQDAFGNSEIPSSYKSIPTGTLRNASKDAYVNRIITSIRDDVNQQMTPPLENPNELAKWLRPHLGEDVSLNEIRNLPYNDMVQLAEEVRSNMKMNEVASRVARSKGFDLDAALSGGRPSLRDRVAADNSRRAYGIYDAPNITLARSIPREGTEVAASTQAVPERVQGIDTIPREPQVSGADSAADINALWKEYNAADAALADLDRRFGNGSPPVDIAQQIDELTATKIKAATRLMNALPDDIQAMRSGSAATREAPTIQELRATASEESPRMQSDPIPFRAANPDANVKPITLREISKFAEKSFKLPVRTGRLGTSDEDVLGLYKRTPEVIRTRNQGGLQELSHELGHHLDKKYNLQDGKYVTELRNLIDEASGIDTAAYTSQELLAEGPAEFMRLYLTDPETAKRLAPRFYDHFESVIPKSDLKNLEKLQEMTARWIDQGEVMQFRGKITEARKESGGSIKERALKAYEAIVDKYTHLATVERAITGSKELTDASENLYKRGRLTAGAPKKAQAIVNEMIKVFKPLEKAKIPLRDFRDFATALHARDLEDLGYETGWTRSQIEKTIQQYDSPLFRKVQADLVAFQDRLIDMAVEGQILTRAAADAMKKKYPNYVPMFREFDDEVASGLITGRGFADLNSPIKKLKGSSRDVKDPIENIVRNVYSIVDSVEKNKVGLELSRISKKEGAGYWIERLAGKQSVRNENIVTVWENGEKVQYQLEPDLYRTIKTLDEDVSNMVVKLLSFPTQLLRGGATLAPEFILRNPIRDQFTAYVASEFGYKPIIDLPKGLFRVIKGKYWKNGDDIYDQWVREGGGYGNTHSIDRNYLREQVSQLKDEGNKWSRWTAGIVNPKQWLRVLQSISELTEEATKVGEFSRGIRKGATPAEAAYQSRDLMDFARVGNSIKQINRVDAFLNANIQGKDKLVRAFLKHPARTTLRALTSVTIPTIGIFMYNDRFANEKQQDKLREAPQWLRDTFYLIAIPGTDVVARIPKPFDLAPVFSNLPENIMRWMKDNDPQSWGEFSKSQAVQLGNFPYMLTALSPAIENMTNYDFFTKGPVVPRRDQDSAPADQYGNNTSSVAKEIGAFLNYSPYKIDNLISGYSASLGKHAISGIDAILDKTGISTRPPAAAKTFSELPVINSFTVDNGGGGKSLDDFYKELDKITERYNSYQDHRKGSSEIVPEYKAISKVSRQISELNSQRRDAQASRDMTPKQKRDYLDELDQHIRSLARQGLDISKKR